MKRWIFLAAVWIVLGATTVRAQDDSTRYINGLPVSEDDTAAQFLQRDFEPKNKIVPVPASALPARLRKELEKEDQYAGWQDTTIYLEKNTGLYIVPLKYAEGVKIFGLNSNGKPVTFREVSVPEP